MQIGSTAAISSNDDIRIDVNLLHDLAELAAAAEADGASPMERLKLWTSVPQADTDLLKACTRNSL
jgi:hypothetical protein